MDFIQPFNDATKDMMAKLSPHTLPCTMTAPWTSASWQSPRTTAFAPLWASRRAAAAPTRKKVSKSQTDLRKIAEESHGHEHGRRGSCRENGCRHRLQHGRRGGEIIMAEDVSKLFGSKQSRRNLSCCSHWGDWSGSRPDLTGRLKPGENNCRPLFLCPEMVHAYDDLTSETILIILGGRQLGRKHHKGAHHGKPIY